MVNYKFYGELLSAKSGRCLPLFSDHMRQAYSQQDR